MSENRNSFIEATKVKDERLEALKQLYPELFSDGKLNLDVLKEITGGENPQEERTPGYYGLYWPGKRKAKIEAKVSPKGTLVPVPGDGVNEATTHNIYIEGDNLEVLRILKQSYRGRVKMIYIDPPYNTGDDFIYPDNYKMAVEEYQKITGQIDEKGNVLTTNLKSSGAFHSKWLSMMYPRLLMARELLAEEGVIFISIDDNEQGNLRLLLDDVFGEENKVAEFIVIRSEGGGMAKQVVKGHDYLFAFAKNITAFTPLGKTKDIRGKIVEKDGEKYWIQEDWLRKEFGKYGNCHYEEILECKGQEKLDEINQGLKDGIYQLIPKSNGLNIVGKLRNIKEDSSKFYSILKYLSAEGIENLAELDMDKYFSYPKPVSLIQELTLGATIFTPKNQEIILDFFSGSSTTAQAVMKLNSTDKGNRKFIMVQFAENLDKMLLKSQGESKKHIEAAIKYLESVNKPHSICEIGKERIRRAGKKILEEAKVNKDMFSEENPLDIGFKVFRMQESNFKEYTPVQGQDENATKSLFEELENNQVPLVDGWKTENVLTEIILKQGFALDCECKKVDSFTKNTVYCIKDSEGPASRTTTMYVCLDSQLDSDTIKNLKLGEKEKFVCLNSAIDDTSYARLADKGRIETI